MYVAIHVHNVHPPPLTPPPSSKKWKGKGDQGGRRHVWTLFFEVLKTKNILLRTVGWCSGLIMIYLSKRIILVSRGLTKGTVQEQTLRWGLHKSIVWTVPKNRPTTLYLVNFQRIKNNVRIRIFPSMNLNYFDSWHTPLVNLYLGLCETK